MSCEENFSEYICLLMFFMVWITKTIGRNQRSGEIKRSRENRVQWLLLLGWSMAWHRYFSSDCGMNLKQHWSVRCASCLVCWYGWYHDPDTYLIIVSFLLLDFSISYRVLATATMVVYSLHDMFLNYTIAREKPGWSLWSLIQGVSKKYTFGKLAEV